MLKSGFQPKNHHTCEKSGKFRNFVIFDKNPGKMA